MKAVIVINECLVDGSTPVDTAQFILDFCATDDPREGQISSIVSLTLSEAQIAASLKQAVVDFINQQRGSTVIAVSDVRLP
jgi:hypothetical protein